jgi:tripartite-type tricarboxylate transporter receptor subunit TctC
MTSPGRALRLISQKSLVPVLFVNSNPLLLIGRKTLAPNTFAELTAWMKTTRAKVASPGVGSTGHLATTLFAQTLGTPVDQIPYRGGTAMFQDLLGGFVDLTFGTPQQGIEPIRSGLLKAYAVTAKEPMAQVPQAVSMVAALGPKLEILYWNALFAPAGTPDAIIAKLNNVVNDAIKDPAIARSFAATGVTAYPEAQRTPQAAKALFHSEIERWGEVVRVNGINASN